MKGSPPGESPSQPTFRGSANGVQRTADCLASVRLVLLSPDVEVDTEPISSPPSRARAAAGVAIVVIGSDIAVKGGALDAINSKNVTAGAGTKGGENFTDSTAAMETRTSDGSRTGDGDVSPRRWCLRKSRTVYVSE